MNKPLLTIYRVILLIICISQSVKAQNNMVAERAPLSKPGITSLGFTPTTQAAWDILFNYDVTSIAGTYGYAGVCFTGSVYWVSRWQTDTITELDLTGTVLDKFTVPGLGVAASYARAFTYDGTYIYASANSTTISAIDPSTKLIDYTITAPSAVRSISYDPGANAGAGGFWISNFGTAITLISRTGVALSNIPAATHTLTNMYGTAYDNVTTGGPYLWVFDQGVTFGGTDSTTLIQLNVSTGLITGVYHDVMADVGSASGLTNGIAGGVFFYENGGSPILMGVTQSNPTNRLFGYDLDFTVGLNENVNNGEFVNVFPTNATTEINVKINKTDNTPASIRIVDAFGKVYFDRSSKGINNYINVSKYSAGMYIVQTIYEGSVYTSRFIKN